MSVGKHAYWKVFELMTETSYCILGNFKAGNTDSLRFLLNPALNFKFTVVPSMQCNTAHKEWFYSSGKILKRIVDLSFYIFH